jgi:hypothetical protein
MVGTRHPTPYGLGMAERLACDLAVQGLVIISGMARGVDADSGPWGSSHFRILHGSIRCAAELSHP